MDRLSQIGFRLIGRWHLEDGHLRLRLDALPPHRSALYAFATGTTVLYVGKTSGALAKRLTAYLAPHATQRTNVRNHASLRQLLGTGSPVDIYGWIDSGLRRVGDFQLSMAAGLEDDIIKVLAPPWNGGRLSTASPVASATTALKPCAIATAASRAPDAAIAAVVAGPVPHPQPSESVPGQFRQHPAAAPATEAPVTPLIFNVRLGKTYYAKGFFNVPVAFSHHLANHGEHLKVFCGKERALLTALLDRKANQKNKTPRIYGRAELARWIRQSKQPGDWLEVTVVGANEILLS